MAEGGMAERPRAFPEEDDECNYENLSLQGGPDMPVPAIKTVPWPKRVVSNRVFREVILFLLVAVLFILLFVHAYIGLPGSHQVNDEEEASQLNDSPGTEGPPRSTTGKHLKESLGGQVEWPNGTYGLPMTDTGCPLAAGVEWQNGTRYQHTSSTYSNGWTTGIHFPPGSYNKGNMKQHFCMKTGAGGRGSWPKGNYCLFMKGGTCPSGFSFGFIRWDDENDNNANSVAGVVPEGVYDKNTLIFYCCRSDGHSSSTIDLPNGKPFYLLRYTSVCQQVRGMIVTQENFGWDTEDSNNDDFKYGVHPHFDTSSFNNGFNLYYCFYHL